jgi:tetratricopeptide (TPR) repeat protein
MNSVIFVTAFKDIHRGDWKTYTRSTQTYLDYFKILIKNHIRIILFAEENIIEFVKKEYNFQFVYPYDEQNTYFTRLEKHKHILESELMKDIRTKTRLRPEITNAEYNIVNFNKFIFLKRAKNMFPFYSHYAWIDFGHCRTEENVFTNFDWNKLPNDKIVFGSFTTEPEIIDPIHTLLEDKGFIKGGLFYVPNHLVEWFHSAFENEIHNYESLQILDNDQALILQIYNKNKSLFMLIPSDWFKLLEYYSIHDIDCVILVAKKDEQICKLCIDAALKNIKNIRNIYIIHERGVEMINNAKNIHYISEFIFPFSKDDIKIPGLPEKRKKWILQQVIKLCCFQFLPKLSETFLILDSDTIFLKNYNFISQDKKINYFISNKCFTPYRNFVSNLFPTIKFEPFGGITHCMIFQKFVLNSLHDMLDRTKCLWRQLLTPISNEKIISEYELYFYFVKTFYPNIFKIDNVLWDISPKLIEKSTCVYMTIHSHEKENYQPHFEYQYNDKKITICLNMIVKNESQIITRLLESVYSIIDTFVICDTGSTDNTIEIITSFFKSKNIQGEIIQEPFKNFGYNRTFAIKAAKNKATYALLLDADMIMQIEPFFDKQKLTLDAYYMFQKNSYITYSNIRLIRLDIDVKCIGPTHEYYKLPMHATHDKLDSLWIYDIGDGGSKSDKFFRDIKLLSTGIEEEPKNERYYFYLAQSYKDIGNYEKAIQYYAKRVEMGGWNEETYFSAYQIAYCHMNLNKYAEMEYWALKAIEIRPVRCETLYLLAKYFRTNNDHFKSYHYILEGRKKPYPKEDVLFIENFCHNGGFEYEASIVEYYVCPDKNIGLKSCFRYLSKRDEYIDNVISNMKFYIQKVNGTKRNVKIDNLFENFHPCVISIQNYPFANVRFVNFNIIDGEYVTKNNEKICTKNAYVNLETGEGSEMKLENKTLFESNVCGIEDIRIYKWADTWYFTGVSYAEYIQNQIGIVHGIYDEKEKELKNIKAIISPFKTCEKNWVNIKETENFVYSWHPLTIGKIREDRIVFFKQIETPKYFSFFRGSTEGIEINSQIYFLVHFIQNTKIRKYYHLFVILDKNNFQPISFSLPFYFRENKIEYCVGMRKVKENSVECFVSLNDKDPIAIEIHLDQLHWINNFDLPL